jgi:phage gpG-like protein
VKIRGKVKLDTGGIKTLQRSVALMDGSEVRVGIFANKTSREGEALTNAEIGAVHELGSKSRNIPMRSFLRVPCLEDLPKSLSGNSGRALVKKLLSVDTQSALENLGVLAEQSVDEAFTTRGKGRWQPLKAATIRRKGSDVPLFDTGKLAASVSSIVVKKEGAK